VAKFKYLKTTERYKNWNHEENKADQICGMLLLFRSESLVLLHQILQGDRIKYDEMGRACSTDGRDDK